MTMSEALSETIRPGRGLRVLCTLNGAGNVAGGAVLLPLIGVLDAPTGLPAPLFTTIGVFYLVYGAAMWFVATRPHPRAAVVAGLISVNPVWALVCLLVLEGNLARPTTLGSVLLVAEAVTVTVLAALQAAAYRRSRRVPVEQSTGDPLTVG